MKRTKNIYRRFARPGLAVAALGGALAIAGCNQAQNTGTAQTNGASSKHEGSRREESYAMNEDGAHANSDALEAPTSTSAPTTRLGFKSEPAQLAAGQSATWTLQVLDAKNGQPVQELNKVHEKLRHLFVVSKDLSWLNHLHPEYQGNGTFTLKVTLPRTGDYKLYADYTPKGGAQEVPQRELRVAGNNPLPSHAALTTSTPQKGGWITTVVMAHPEGQPDVRGGMAYEVALMPMPTRLKSGEAAMLHFQIRDAKGQPVKELQPYMGAMGHAFILSDDTQRSLHAHPMEGGMNHDTGSIKHDMKGMKHGATSQSGGSDVIFHTIFPTPGLYKAWGQFKHKGQVITAGFALNVVQGQAAPGTAQSASGGHDESRPHSH